MVTVNKIAQHIQADITGDGNFLVTGAATLAEAKVGDISFIVSTAYLPDLEKTQASVIIVTPQLQSHVTHKITLVHKNPYLAMAKVAELFQSRTPWAVRSSWFSRFFSRLTGKSILIHKTAVIGRSTHIDPTAILGAYVVVGDNVVIGKNTIIEPHVVISHNVTIGNDCHIKARVVIAEDVFIGDRVILHEGSVIGSDGFGNANDQGKWYKIPQLGRVIIQNDVEIGANTTVDCGTLGDTVIEDGVRIDNLVQIAHNVRIGAHTAIAGQAGIAGSTTIGKQCLIGGQAGINGHITITDNVVFTAQAMVTTSIDTPGVYSSGTGLLPNAEWRRAAVHFRQADKTAQTIKTLKKAILKDEDKSI